MSFKASPICFQPLDLAPFGPLKAKLETLSSAWHHDNKGDVLNKYTLMPNVAYQAFEEVFSNRELIKTGFRIAGLFPWNRAAVHWEKLAPGSLYAEKTPQGGAMVVTDEVAAVIELSDEVEGNMELSDEVARNMELTEDLAGDIELMAHGEVREDVVEDDAPGSVCPPVQDVSLGAVGGIAVEWAHDVEDPSLLGPVDPAVANNLETPEVILPPAQVENQVNNAPTGADILNFVPEHGANLVDIFPESNHEEKVHLLQR